MAANDDVYEEPAIYHRPPARTTRRRARPTSRPTQRPTPSRLMYGFSVRAAERIREAEGIERLMLVVGAIILTYFGARVWLTGAHFTVDGIVTVVAWFGYRLIPGWEIWSIPVLLTIAEFGLKRPKADVFFGIWMIAFALDAATTGLGIYPATVGVSSQATRIAYAALGGALFAWSAEACLQCGVYALWRSLHRE